MISSQLRPVPTVSARACRCISYNNPQPWQTDPEAVLSPELFPVPWQDRPNGICVDACIADVIRHLWALGIPTEACCCGHNEHLPNVALAPSASPGFLHEVLDAIAQVDNRQWTIGTWRMIWTVRFGSSLYQEDAMLEMGGGES